MFFKLIVVDFKTSFSAGKKVAKLNNFSFPERKLHAQLTVNHFFFKSNLKIHCNYLYHFFLSTIQRCLKQT